MTPESYCSQTTGRSKQRMLDLEDSRESAKNVLPGAKSEEVFARQHLQQLIHPQNQLLNVETLDLKAMWVQGPHVTVSSSQKNTVTSGDNGWT